MRHLFTSMVLATCATAAIAQSPICNDLPIGYDAAGILFTTADMAFGDSVISVPITNLHPTQGMAYPQAKVVPLTPLPPGMVLNTHWYTFASSWNPGETMPANFFFDVATQIPPDFTVTFELWAYNLTPLMEDSCVFDSTFTLNLNPAPAGIGDRTSADMLEVGPVPASDELIVVLRSSAFRSGSLDIYNSVGQRVVSAQPIATPGRETIDVRHLPPGTYVILVTSSEEGALKRRFVVAR